MLKINSVYTKQEIIKQLNKNDLIIYLHENGEGVGKPHKIQNEDKLFLKNIYESVCSSFGSGEVKKCFLYYVIVPQEIILKRFYTKK